MLAIVGPVVSLASSRLSLYKYMFLSFLFTPYAIKFAYNFLYSRVTVRTGRKTRSFPHVTSIIHNAVIFKFQIKIGLRFLILFAYCLFVVKCTFQLCCVSIADIK